MDATARTLLLGRRNKMPYKSSIGARTALVTTFFTLVRSELDLVWKT
jgi:hypothetical protein